jgi:predicted RNase H-like nuclease (RuvC/YqgF family)
VNGNEYVPTLAEIWDFLVGFKEATEAGFRRVDASLARLTSDVTELKFDVSELKSDVSELQSHLERVERRVIRIDDRLSAVETLNVSSRLDDHERRIAKLEGQPN